MGDTAEKANNAKSEFVSVVSHELRSPITTLKGYTSLLLTGVPGPVNENQANFLNRVEESINQMESLVSELSDISQIESGHLKLEMKSVSIADNGIGIEADEQDKIFTKFFRSEDRNTRSVSRPFRFNHHIAEVSVTED